MRAREKKCKTMCVAGRQRAENENDPGQQSSDAARQVKRATLK